MRDDKRAALATLLFCCNPASVFHAGVYTESVFAMLSLLALNLLSAQPFAAATVFGLSAAARSNGVVSVCFIAHEGIRRILCAGSSGECILTQLSVKPRRMKSFAACISLGSCNGHAYGTPGDGANGNMISL